LETIILEFIKEHAPEAMRSQLATNLTTFIIAWWFVRKSVKEHFKSIGDSLKSLTVSVDELKTSIISLETSHGLRISNLEDNVEKLKTAQTKKE
jgi:hypothetical protein